MSTGRDRGERMVFARVGIALALVLLVALNVLAGSTLDRARLDLTENKLFTLSQGTREALARIEEPISLRLYLSRSLADQVPFIYAYGQRVRELLEQYVALSNGKIDLAVLDPEPFSVTEDEAVAFGVQGAPVGQSGERAYVGLVGVNSTDDRKTIGFFDPAREMHLEYDLTRLIYDLANPEKKIVGVLSAVLQGQPRFGRLPWAFNDQLRDFFDLRIVSADSNRIDADVDVLLIVQPPELKDEALYAIDQFVLRGGRVLVFVDPLVDEAQVQGIGPSASETNFDRLLSAWGIAFDPQKFVGDGANAMQVGLRDRSGREVVADYVSWITLREPSLNADDVVTSQLKQLSFASAGALDPAPGATTTFERLVWSSPQSMLMDIKDIRFNPDPLELARKFQPGGTPFTLAARVRGPARSAFETAPADSPLAAEHLAESKNGIHVIVVADADLLADRFWFREQTFFGQRILVPTSNNADLAINALDNLVGSGSLIDLRGRGLSSRPFELVHEIQRQAELRYRKTEQDLLAKLEDTQKKLAGLESEQPRDAAVIVSEQQRQELDRFRAEMLQTRAQLRDVQFALRQDIDRLDTLVKVLNILAVPALFAALALGIWVVRRIRFSRHAGSA